MIYFFYGENNFLITKKYRDRKESFLAKNPNAHLDIFDCDETCEFQTIKEAFSVSGGLFSSKKIIILQNVFSLSTQRQESLLELLKENKKDDQQEILIVENKKPKPTGKLANFLKKNVMVELCEKVPYGKLQHWVQEEISKRSGGKLQIEEDACVKLVEISKNNMWFLDCEIEKMISFRTKGKIDFQDVEKLSRGEVETGIFELVDAIGSRDKAKAIELKNSLLRQGENEFYVFSMIISQMRNLIKVMQCVKKKQTDHNAVAKICGMHPFVAKKTLAQLRGYSEGQLKSIFLLASETDRKAKTGETDMGEALDYFILKT